MQTQKIEIILYKNYYKNKKIFENVDIYTKHTLNIH